MHDKIKIDEVLKISNLKITDEEFDRLKDELFKEIRERFIEAYSLPEITLAFASVSIGNLMALANEKNGVQGVLKLATEYVTLFNSTLLDVNDELRLEIMKRKNKKD